ncbi:MAG: SPOR domain-containing protein, partial [Pontibacterium sp.]
SSLERFYKQYGKEGYHAFSTDFKGRPFYVIVYGQYETRKKAAEAVVTLPEAAQKLKPWARTVKGIQNDIRK